MSPELYLRGIALGFAIAAALGPVGLLVIRRTIDRGWSYGFVSGLGVATADAVYGAVAAFGITAISDVLLGIDRPLAIVGGLVLVLLGLRGIWGTRSGAPIAARRERAGAASRLDSRFGAWASMVGLTLTNPATILSFAALFAALGAGTGGPAGGASVVAGVFTGSAAWWASLTGLTAGLRARLTPSVVRLLNVASALVIAGFGVVAIAVGVIG